MDGLTLQGRAIPQAASPNHGPRPTGAKPCVIVLHSTCCSLSVARNWLCSPQSKVSAHFLVGRSGRVEQLVPLGRTAWHAGVSSWRGRAHVNRFSIGIEMEHLDGQQDWPAMQVKAVVALCRLLMSRYDIPVAQIVSHAEVARPHGRKVDPVAFPWAALRKALG